MHRRLRSWRPRWKLCLSLLAVTLPTMDGSNAGVEGGRDLGFRCPRSSVVLDNDVLAAEKFRRMLTSQASGYG